MPPAIYFPKWVDLLIALYNTPQKQRYCGCLHRKTGITTRHLRNLIAVLVDLDLVVSCQRGNNKIRYLDLTEKGRQLAEALLKIASVTVRT